MVFGKKIEVWVRDLTLSHSAADVSSDLRLELPDENLGAKLTKEHEYIIIESELGFDEYTSVYEINEWLLEQDCDTVDLRILSKTYLWNEVMRKIENDEFQILDFDAETETYNCVCGVVFDEWWIGYVLHENGMMFEWEIDLINLLGYDKAKEIVADMEDDLRYDNLCATAECEGVRRVCYNGNHYLVW